MSSWLAPAQLKDVPSFHEGQVEFDRAIAWKLTFLRQAFERFRDSATDPDQSSFARFREENQDWLDDYSLFMALKDQFGGVQWTQWSAAAASRECSAIEKWRQSLADETQFYAFIQWQFLRQWLALKAYANVRGVRIVGDVPIFVAHDSADVWANRQLFQLRDDGEPRLVAGVPPDYFSETGQRWGNPLYDWPAAAATGYAWWLQRLEQAFKLFDLVRLDHFRGFAAYWEIPAENETAAGGRWVPGPGAALFEALQKKLGKLPLIAEDLGVITPDVEALRDQFALPRHAGPAIRLRRRPQSRRLSPAQLHSQLRRLYGYARQRHHCRLVPQRSRRLARRALPNKSPESANSPYTICNRTAAKSTGT